MARLITNALDLGIGEYTEVATLLAGSAITAKTPVCLDATKTGEDRMRYVIPSTTAIATEFVGIALEAQATVGDPVRVAVAGYVEGAVTDTNVGQHDSLIAGAAVVLPYTAASTDPIVGAALEADVVAACDVVLNGYGKGLLGL